MKRAFTIFVALSGVLAVATLLLWIDSIWFARVLCRQPTPQIQTSLTSTAGRFLFVRSDLVNPAVGFGSPSGSREGALLGIELYTDIPFAGATQFEWTMQRDRKIGWSALNVSVPHWAVALVLMIGPAFWYIVPHRRRAKRRAANCCEHCGYDLRATPTRCPECGARPATSDTSVAEHV